MRPACLTVLLLLSACQPQARRVLVLDLTLSEPALLNGTVQPWRDEGYNVEYRRFYPHLARADLDRYRVLLYLLGREPEAPSDALTVGDLALLTEWVLRGGVAVLGYDADGEGYLDRWTANRWLDFVGAGISIGDRLLEDTTARALTTTGRPQPWAEARAGRHAPLRAPLGAGDPPFPPGAGGVAAWAGGVAPRAPRRARRPGHAATGAHPGGGGPPAPGTAGRRGHHRPPARPRSQARPCDQRSRMAATAGDARSLGAAPPGAGRSSRHAAWSLARLARHAARRRRVQYPRRRCRPGWCGLGARTLGGAGRRAARLGGRGGQTGAYQRRVDSRPRLRARTPQSRRLVTGDTGRGAGRAVRARFGTVGGGNFRRVRRARPAGRGAAHAGDRPRLGHRRPARLLDGPGVLRRGVAARDRRPGHWGDAGLAALPGPLRRAAGRRAVAALLPSPRRRGHGAGSGFARPDPEAAAGCLFC